MNKFKLFLISLLLIFSIGCAQRGQVVTESAEETAEATDPDITPTPRPTRPVQNNTTIVADGVIKAAQPMLPLSFATSGRVLTLLVQPGDAVEVGDTIATLDDSAVQEAIANAQLQVVQAENSLAQTQLDLDNLLAWEPDELAIAQAEANLTAAQTQLANAETQDAVAGNSVTQARVSVEQAERGLTDAQEAYDTAFDPGREWELNSPFYADRLKAEREGATRNLQFAEEQLEVARANLALAGAGVNNDTAVSAQSSVASAQLSLEQAQQGPKPEEVTAAQLRVQQAEISLQQSQLSLTQTENDLLQLTLISPASGTVLSVDVSVGTTIGAGSPIVTLLNTAELEFHTTNLSERDLAQVVPGQTAIITLKTYPNDLIEGTVLRIGLQAEGTVGDSAVFPVMIGLEATDLEVRPGMTGRVEIVREEE
jgi:multidrug efflux pump subunit AcrA (membrane-fusion protein)